MSNRLTFSLASLILIFAFVAMPVMAHTGTGVRPHTHPVTEVVPAFDSNGDGDTTDYDIGDFAELPIHGVHPVPTITLKANEDQVKGNEVIITADDSATTDVNENTFTVVIGFDVLVDDDATSTAAADDINIAAADFNIVLLDKMGVPVTTGAATIAAAVRAGSDPVVATDPIEAVITIPEASVPTGTEDMSELTLQLLLRDGSESGVGVFSLQQVRIINAVPTNIPGGHSLMSNLAEFKLVQEFTVAPPPPDTTPPVVTITAPDMANTDGTLTFMISFDEALGTGLSALTIDDLTIDGGTAMATDLTGPAADTNDYTLMVTPDSADASVTVTLNSNSVADADGNALLDTSATGNTASATYDITPPTVMIMPPDMPDADGNLTFTFDFSEPVMPDTIELDRSGSDNVRLGPNSDPMVDADDNTIYTILVTPADPMVDTTVLLLKGSVKDMNGNGLAADAEATYMVPVTNTAPVFDDPAPTGLTWCEAETIVSIVLPKARDAEGDELTYSLTGDGDLAGDTRENPTTAPTMGLYWVTVDAETRQLRGTAATGDAGTYTWTATDENGASNVTPLTFTIVVTPYEEPMKVTGVMAMKVDAEAMVGDDADKVKLTWTDPNPTAYPNADCIPMVTSYTVTMQELNTHTLMRTAKGMPMTFTVTGEGTNPPAMEYITDKLDHGTYEFTVTATNLGGTSEASDKAVWDKTMYHWVIVDNPPMASQNLRANQTEQPAHSVTLDWIPPTHNPDAPVNDAADAMALYGVDMTFGGYHVEVTNQSTAVITNYPTDSSLIAGDQRTYHITGLEVGEYTARIVAHNVIGAGALSNSQDFEIDVYQPGPTPTDNNAPVFAEGTSIANIVAKIGDRVPGRFLPQATDADGDDLEYTLEPDLPAGLNFDEETRALTGVLEATAEVGEKAYTYTADDGEDQATLGFFITVNAATAGPPPTSTPTTMLPANGYIVYVRDAANPPHFGTSNPMIAEWAAMPNLYELFTEGGGGSLQLTVNGVNARQVVFSEVMWAVDLGKVGQDSYDGNQWIELRNRTANAIPISSISFATKVGRPALAQNTDLISNVVGGGSDWIKDKGQNGNSGAADGSGQVPFKSMFRKRYHNDSAGWNGGEWLVADQVYHPNHYGTPGVGEPKGAVIIGASGVALGTVINEIANHPSSNADHEWIELRKKEGELSNLENWVIDMVTGVDQQKRLFKIPKLNDGRYGNILLITKTDPARDDDHPLRGGYDVTKDFADQDNEGRDENIRYYVAKDWSTDLPDNGEFVLILRHGSDKTNHEKVEDIAGWHPNLKVDSATFFTNLWPLRGYPAPVSNKNAIVSGAVHRRQHAGIVGTGTTHNDKKDDQVALRDVGWTGVGYKRNADAGAQNGGTPGYANNALLSNETTSGTMAKDVPPVIISEIMYARGNRGNMPQWIELRNTSLDRGINMDGWRVTIVNHDTNDGTEDYLGDLNKSYNVNGKISPGETFLIVAHSGTNNTNLPSERIHSLSNKRGQQILSEYGFEITLETRGKDGNNNNRQVVDMVGNLVDLPTGRVRANYQSYEDPVWMLPAGTDDSGNRVSIIRTRRKTDNTYVGGLRDGKIKGAWISFDESAHLNAPESTYYGNRNDLSNPGYTVGGPLPVSLSKFRPERMKETGEVIIRWVTESETNNAGFNILRGEALDGEFTKINTELIAGKGTTTERTLYEYPDKSAKPNVIYYYQIQDVSLDGEVQTLRTTHLRGNVNAAGKLTTTWGELKALQ